MLISLYIPDQIFPNHFVDVGIRVHHMHHDIDTVESNKIVRDLMQSVFDVFVGINLLREGLDIPEVALVAILMRRRRVSCARHGRIQTVGRALNSKVSCSDVCR